MTEEENVDWERLEQDATGVDPRQPRWEIQVMKPEMLSRRLVWDIAPCELAERTVEVLGLPQVSDDVEEKEHLEAHDRLDAVAFIAPLVDHFSLHAASAVVAATVVEHREDDPDYVMSESDKNDAVSTLGPLVFQTSIALIAELVDLGMLHLPHGLAGGQR